MHRLTSEGGARYGGKEDAPGSNDNSDDEAALQPVPLVIETISGGGGGAEGEVKKEATVAAAPPLTGDDATLQRYREAYKTKPEMYTKKARFFSFLLVSRARVGSVEMSFLL